MQQLVHSFRNKPTPPPPLPPHGIQQKRESTIDEYRPPVPPHRNVTPTSKSNNSTPEPVQVRKQHHHHYRNSKQQTPDRDSRHSQRYVKPLMDFAGADQDEASSPQQQGKRSVFEFDDEPQETAKGGVKMRTKSCKNDGDEDVYFVQYPRSPNSNGNGVCVCGIVF